MRTLLAEPPPAEAEVYKTLRWVVLSGGARPTIKVWRGKQKKPRYYGYRTPEQLERWLTEQKAAEDRDELQARQRKSADLVRLQEQLDRIQVGTLLHYSWGYDQTNCDFYQVVAKKGRSVTLREIGSKSVPGSEGFMCDKRVPVRDEFIGEPFTKIIGKHGISMDYGSCTPTRDDEQHYCSWYA